jgi:hypothetical protein
VKHCLDSQPFRNEQKACFAGYQGLFGGQNPVKALLAGLERRRVRVQILRPCMPLTRIDDERWEIPARRY